MSDLATDARLPRFSWLRSDVEARLGLTGGRFTDVRPFVWFVAALGLTVAFYALLSLLPQSRLVETFTLRGPIQYVTVLFTFWCLAMLLVKTSKIAVQRQTLAFTDLVPPDPDFVLSPGTVASVLARIRQHCDDPTRFFLFNRIGLALSNLRNIGRVADVDEVLRSQAQSDENVMESSYSLLRGLIWAIPVLGFIGTVQGLSQAMGQFGGVLENTADFAQLRPALQRVTAGLSTAFDTTFVALVAALFLQLLMTMIRKSEEDLLDRVAEYCTRHIVGRLRLTPLDPAAEA